MHLRRDLLFAFCAAVLAVWIYYPALDTLPVADDFRIVGRTSFHDAARAFSDTVGYGRNEYRPLVALSFALSNWLWNGDPRGYHLESILLHALVVALLFVWLRQLTGSAMIAGLAAVLFAVHPIHHARVVWIAARDSLPSTVCMLLALILYTRSRQEAEGGAGRRARLIALSVVFFLASLLSYEGAVILPGIIMAMEFFLFAGPEQNGFTRRLRDAAVRMIPYVLTACVYLIGWLVLFRGEVGQYDIRTSFADIAQNCYRLMYALFHGNQRLAGLLYFLLLPMGLLLPRGRRVLIWFSLVFMLLAYVPFVAIAGFASRFGYVSAIGYVLLIATIVSHSMVPRNTAWIPALRRWLPALAAAVFISLAWYYTVALRSRIDDWRMAGEIAAAIPREVKERYPDLPENAVIVLARIPRMNGHAYVFPLGLQTALQSMYPGRNLQVHYGPGEVTDILKGKEISSPKLIYFRYLPEQHTIEEIVAESGGQ